MSEERGTTLLTEVEERPVVGQAEMPTNEEADLRILRALLEESDVEGARRFIEELAQRWPESAEVQHFARVLAPPRTRVTWEKPLRRMDLEYAWLKEHAREYAGQWVALLGDRLIAADADLAAVLRTVRQTPEAAEALLHHCPKRRD